MDRKELLSRVRELFGRALEARFQAMPQATRTRAQGYADGYMRALVDAGVVEQRALLEVIGGVRSRHASADAPQIAAEDAPQVAAEPAPATDAA